MLPRGRSVTPELIRAVGLVAVVVAMVAVMLALLENDDRLRENAISVSA